MKDIFSIFFFYSLHVRFIVRSFLLSQGLTHSLKTQYSYYVSFIPLMASSFLFHLVLSITFAGVRAQPNQSSLINLGTKLTYPSSWLSPSNRFAFGFYQEGSGFVVGIWLVGKDNTTVVWTINCDNPPVNSKAMLDFTRDGKLLLRAEKGPDQVIASAKVPVSYAAMLDYGNFVLYDKDYKIIWQSFDYPTDTILGGQTVYAGGQLLSGFDQSDQSIRRFLLVMQSDGNLVSYPANSEKSGINAYWATGTSGGYYNPNGFHLDLSLNFSGGLILINESNSIPFILIHTSPETSTSKTIAIPFIMQPLMLMKFSDCILTPTMRVVLRMIMLINAPEQSPKSLVLGIAAPEVEDRICELPLVFELRSKTHRSH